MKKEEEKKEIQEEGSFFKEILPYVVILIIVIIVRIFVATPVRVSGPSMEPTLKSKEMLILNKLGKLERFKVVVVDNKKDYLIKRIIALPGETIEYKNNKLYIDGKEVEDKYGSGNTKDFGPIELSDDEYFVMGDNREDSTDSRILGPIKKKKIKGTTTIRLLPLKKIGNINKK